MVINWIFCKNLNFGQNQLWCNYFPTNTDLARVQHCQQKINNLEAEAERARTQNRVLMADYSSRLKEKSRYLGQSLSLVRPFFEARKQSIRRRTEAEQLSTQYHQTIQMLKGARELVKLGYYDEIFKVK